MNLDREKRMAARVPNYPGRKALEAAVSPLARKLGTNRVQRLLGFWVLWHTYGSLSAIIDAGLMGRSSAYGARRDFLAAFGVNVEDFLPEVGELLAETREPVSPHGRS